MLPEASLAAGDFFCIDEQVCARCARRDGVQLFVLMSTATVLKGSLNLGIRANDESFKHGFGTHGENSLQRRPRRLLRREDVFITLRLFVFALFCFSFSRIFSIFFSIFFRPSFTSSPCKV